MIFAISLPMMAAQPKPWNVCAAGHQLPATPIEWEATDEGYKWRTPQDPSALEKIKACGGCETIALERIILKINTKYGGKKLSGGHTGFKNAPSTNVFILNTAGEIEERPETITKKIAESKPASAAVKSASGAAENDK